MNDNKLISTQKKLTALFTLLIFTIISVFGVIFFTGKYLNTQKNEKGQFFQATQMFVNEYEKNPENILNLQEQIPPDFKSNPRRENMLPRRNQIFRELEFIILDKSNQIIFQNIRSDISQEVFEFTLKNVGVEKKDDYMTRFIQTKTNNFVFFQHQGYSGDDFLEEIMVFLLINIIFTLGFACIGWYFVRKILTPVEQNISDMKDFVHNAGHELKTPLAVMSSNFQLLKGLKNYDEDLVLNSIEEIKKMDSLIVGLSQLSDIQPFSHQEKINPKDNILSILQELSTQIEKKELSLVEKLDDNISIIIHGAYFDILIRNLLINAIKYNHHKGVIEIILTKKYLKITNTGELIPDNKKESIFERFYRLDSSRSTPGFGIGLSLVKKICEIQKWKISVYTKENKNEFMIEF